MKKLILLAVFFLMVSTNAFGQAKEITREESQQQIIDASVKVFDGALRINLKEDYFKNGRLTGSREVIKESVSPKKWREVKIDKSGKRIERFEIIHIDGTFYCRKNSGAWKTSDDWCGENERFSAISGEEETTRFTLEETKVNNQSAKHYRQYITYKDDDLRTYWNYTFWTNKEGFFLRREIEYGLLKPKRISSKMTEAREYNPKDIKIEAPIK